MFVKVLECVSKDRLATHMNQGLWFVFRDGPQTRTQPRCQDNQRARVGGVADAIGAIGAIGAVSAMFLDFNLTLTLIGLVALGGSIGMIEGG